MRLFSAEKLTLRSMNAAMLLLEGCVTWSRTACWEMESCEEAFLYKRYIIPSYIRRYVSDDISEPRAHNNLKLITCSLLCSLCSSSCFLQRVETPPKKRRSGREAGTTLNSTQLRIYKYKTHLCIYTYSRVTICIYIYIYTTVQKFGVTQTISCFP